MIHSLQAAFDKIEAFEYGIPFEAIEYVYNHPTEPIILDKIAYALKHAHHEELFSSLEEEWIFSPALWYAIIAEGHLDPRLFQPVIEVFTVVDDDQDFLYEQCSFLVGKLAQQYPDQFIPKAFDEIEIHALSGSSMPYLYLFDVCTFCDIEQYKPTILRLLKHPNFYYLGAFVSQISVLPIPELLPILDDLQVLFAAKNELEDSPLTNHTLIEIEEALRLQKGEEPIEEAYLKSYSEKRGHWREHYEAHAPRFYPAIPKPAGRPANRKIGRNEPCPCGSGKKYKKCCL